MDRYYVGTYWLGRRESAKDCARRAELFFQLSAECDPIFSSWFEKGWTLEEALVDRFVPKESTLLKDFLQQAQTEGRFPEEGFRLGLWNGEANEAASSLSVLCGDGSDLVSNCCAISLPAKGPAAERVLRAPVLARLLRAMVLAWEPEWGVVTSHQHRKQVSDSSEAGTFVGWLTYFSHRRGPLPALPPPVRVEPLEDKGSLVLLTPERLSSSDPSHLQLARNVASRLSPLGLLSPLTALQRGQEPEPV